MNISDTNGNYLKTACLVQSVQSYDPAQIVCQNNNMPSLYAISTADDYTGIKTFGQKISMEIFSATLWKHYAISGVQQVDGRWFNRNPLMTPLLKDAIPMHCLFIEGWSGTLKFHGIPCYRRVSHGVCEYNKNTQTSTNCPTKYDVLGPGSVYIKTVCLMQQNVDAITNHQNCKNNGMSGLYTIGNADEAQGIKNYITSLGSITGAVFEIGGLGVGPKWYYPDGQNFFIGYPDIVDNGCLCIEGFPNGFIANFYYCNEANWFVCEFKYETF